MQNKHFRYRDDKFLSSENLIEWKENNFTKFTPTMTYPFQDNSTATPEMKEDTIIQYMFINENIICFYKSGHVRFSSDNGDSWNESDKPVYDYYYGSGSVFEERKIVGGLFDLKTIDGTILLSDYNGNIFKSTNGINWSNISSTLNNKYKYSVFLCNNSYFAVGVTEYFKNKDNTTPFFILYKSNDLLSWAKVCEYDNSKYKSEMNMDKPSDANYRQKYINMVYINNIYYIFSTDSVDYLKIDAASNITLDSNGHNGLEINQYKTADILSNELFYSPSSGNVSKLNIYDNKTTYPFTSKYTLDLIKDIESNSRFPETYIKAWQYESHRIEPFYLYDGSSGVNKLGELTISAYTTNTYSIPTVFVKNNYIEITGEKEKAYDANIAAKNNDFEISDIDKYSRLVIDYEFVTGTFSTCYFGYVNSEYGLGDTDLGVCMSLIDQKDDGEKLVNGEVDNIRYTRHINLDSFNGELRKLLTGTSEKYPVTKYRLGICFRSSNNKNDPVFRIYKIWLE